MQQNFTLPNIPNIDYTSLITFVPQANSSEDCMRFTGIESAPFDETHVVIGLYANVFRPAGTTEQSKLPVVVVSSFIIQDGTLISSNWRFAVVLWRVVRHRRRFCIQRQYFGSTFGRARRTGHLRKLQLPVERLWLAWRKRSSCWGGCQRRLA